MACSAGWYVAPVEGGKGRRTAVKMERKNARRGIEACPVCARTTAILLFLHSDFGERFPQQFFKARCFTSRNFISKIAFC